MSGKRDSNSRPRPWQGRALPTELLPQVNFLWKIYLRRIWASPRHSESKLSLCSRLAPNLPRSSQGNHFNIPEDKFPKEICQSSMLSDESGAKVVVLGRLTKTIGIFFGLSDTFYLERRASRWFWAVSHTSWAFIVRQLRSLTTILPFTITMFTSDA